MKTAEDMADTAQPVRVLIVDDSSMTRWLMQRILDDDPRIDVVGLAADALEARRMIKELEPDVITLDIEMPGVNGIDFLRHLMRARPMPVVMVSTLTQRGAQVTLDALALGAVDFISKPKMLVSKQVLAEYSFELTTKVKVASTAHVQPGTGLAVAPTPARFDEVGTSRADTDMPLSQELIAVGASTGGTEALPRILRELPPDGPGVVVVQHISDAFNEPFTVRLDHNVKSRVCQARQDEPIRYGHVYVAPPGHHLRVRKIAGGFACELGNGGPVNYHRPSVDVLFASVAAHAGRSAIGVILTGMGRDGASGLLDIREAGGFTIAQDEDSSVVWGMPGASVGLGAVAKVLPLRDIAAKIRARCDGS